MGAYRIAGLAGGRYRVEVSDPLLDSLDLGLAVAPVTVAESQTVVVRLAIPSRLTLACSCR